MSNLCVEMSNMQVSGGQHGWPLTLEANEVTNGWPEPILPPYPRWVGGWLGGWVLQEEQGEEQGTQVMQQVG